MSVARDGACEAQLGESCGGDRIGGP